MRHLIYILLLASSLGLANETFPNKDGKELKTYLINIQQNGEIHQYKIQYSVTYTCSSKVCHSGHCQSASATVTADDLSTAVEQACSAANQSARFKLITYLIYHLLIQR